MKKKELFWAEFAVSAAQRGWFSVPVMQNFFPYFDGYYVNTELHLSFLRSSNKLLAFVLEYKEKALIMQSSSRLLLLLGKARKENEQPVYLFK